MFIEDNIVGKVKHSGIPIRVNSRCGCIYVENYGHLFYHEDKNKEQNYRSRRMQKKVMDKLGITDCIKDIEWCDNCIDNYLR